MRAVQVYLALSILRITAAHVDGRIQANPSNSVAWLQQGGDAANQGFGQDANYSGSQVKTIFNNPLGEQQCQSGSLAVPQLESFFFVCWNYQFASSQNYSLFQTNMQGEVLAHEWLTSFPQGPSWPNFNQWADPAIWLSEDPSSHPSMVFVQTLVELRVWEINGQGILSNPVSLALNDTELVGTQLTIDQLHGLIYMVSNYKVYCFEIKGFSSSSVPLWTYDYPNPGNPPGTYCTLSGTGLDTYLIYTISCQQWGTDIVALDPLKGARIWHSFYSMPNVTTIASTPLLAADRVFISFYPLGLVVLDESSGTILTNGSYSSMHSATGQTPSLWMDAETENSWIVYECQNASTKTGGNTVYSLCLADPEGDPATFPSSAGIPMLGCLNGSSWTSYPMSNQPFITGNNVLVAAMASDSDGLTCVQAFDLSSGKEILSWQNVTVLTDMEIYGSPFVDQNSTIYLLAWVFDAEQNSNFIAIQGIQTKTDESTQIALE